MLIAIHNIDVRKYEQMWADRNVRPTLKSGLCSSGSTNDTRAAIIQCHNRSFVRLSAFSGLQRETTCLPIGQNVIQSGAKI